MATHPIISTTINTTKIHSSIAKQIINKIVEASEETVNGNYISIAILTGRDTIHEMSGKTLTVGEMRIGEIFAVHVDHNSICLILPFFSRQEVGFEIQ